MDAERWHRIDEVVQAAVELDPEARSRYVREACAGDDEMRATVERLLSFDEREFPLVEGSALTLLAEMAGFGAPALRAGAAFGDFEILDLLGAGGMGEVYLARDTRLGRKVALKLLPADLSSDPSRLRRFQTEARAASALSHPNIVAVYEIGRSEGQPFMATEFVEGRTLRELMSEGRLAVDEAVAIATQAAEALAAAHGAGIVHRDVKPENVMVRPDGYVKVLDFGLAKLAEPGAIPETSDTAPGLIMGTVRYMSPEQARGLPLDARTDLFSLGVVLYEMVAGRTPFEGETDGDRIAELLKGDVVPVGAHAPAAPAELEQVLVKALSKQRERRYQSAGELLADLKALARDLGAPSQAGRSETSATPSHSDRARRARPGAEPRLWRPRLARALAVAVGGETAGATMARGIVAGSLAALLAAAYFGAPQIGPGRAEPFQRSAIRKLAGGESTATATVSPDGSSVAEIRDGSDGPSLWIRELATNGADRIAGPLGDAYVAPSFSPDSSHVYYGVAEPESQVPSAPPMVSIYRIAVRGGGPQRVLSRAFGAVGVSSDGARLAFVRAFEGDATALFVARADGSDERRIASRNAPDYFAPGGPAWSPDGERVACGTMEGLVVVSARGGAETPVVSDRFGSVDRVVWLAETGGMVLLAGERAYEGRQIWHLSYPDFAARKITNDLDNYVTVSVTADEKTIVSVQAGVTSNLWVAPGGDADRAMQITGGRYNKFQNVRWTPDGRIVAPACPTGKRELWVLNADGSGMKQLTSDMTVTWPAVSADGRYVVFTSRSPENALEIWRADVDGGDPTRLASGHAPTCSPEGWVYYHDGEGGLWRVPIGGGEASRLSDRLAGAAEVSPDGTLVACRYEAETGGPARTAVLRIEDAKVVTTLDVPSFPVRWTPDGRALTYADCSGGDCGIWRVPLEGGSPTKIATFRSFDILGFDWSRDGSLVCALGTSYNELVLLAETE